MYVVYLRITRIDFFFHFFLFQLCVEKQRWIIRKRAVTEILIENPLNRSVFLHLFFFHFAKIINPNGFFVLKFVQSICWFSVCCCCCCRFIPHLYHHHLSNQLQLDAVWMVQSSLAYNYYEQYFIVLKFSMKNKRNSIEMKRNETNRKEKNIIYWTYAMRL